MSSKWFLFQVCVLKFTLTYQFARYDDFNVLRIDNINFEQYIEIKEKLDNLNISIEQIDIGHPNSIDILYEKKDNNILQGTLQPMGIYGRVMVNNIQRLIDQEKFDNDKRARINKLKKRSQPGTSSNFDLSSYHTLSEIYQWLDNLEQEFPTIVKIHDIGDSYEKRPLKVVQISTELNQTLELYVYKPAIWIDAGIHAREWITVSTALYVITQLISVFKPPQNSTSNAAISLKANTWYIMPVINPDGYEFTHTKDRLWRRSRSRIGLYTKCKGVDLNRNFGYQWRPSNQTKDGECDLQYGGPSQFSEPENRAIASFLIGISTSLKAYVNMHNYMQIWVSPWSWINQFPDDIDDMRQLGYKLAKSSSNRHNLDYTYGTAGIDIYRAYGSVIDWVYGHLGIVYTYAVELRDKGYYKFLIRPDQIIPTGEEIWDSFKVLASHVSMNCKEFRSCLKESRLSRFL